MFLKQIDLSESSCDLPFANTRRFCTSPFESIFTEKLAEIKEKHQNNQNQSPKKSSQNNPITENFFSPKSSKTFKDYSLNEKLRIKWLRVIRDYTKIQQTQLVFNYLKTAHVFILMRELRLRKFMTLWKLRYQQETCRDKWKQFASFLLKKQLTANLIHDAKKVEKVKARLERQSRRKKERIENEPTISNDMNELAKQNVQEILAPLATLQPLKQTQSHESANHSHSHETDSSLHQSRDVSIANEEEEEPQTTTEEKIANLQTENEILLRRIREGEKREKVQKQFLTKFIKLGMIFGIVFTIFFVFIGVMIGKSVRDTEGKLKQYISNQATLTQDLASGLSILRSAVENLTGTNNKTVPDTVRQLENELNQTDVNETIELNANETIEITVNETNNN